MATEKKYISFEEFAYNSNVKESTAKGRLGDIPGITVTEDGIQVLSGTRYPCDLHRYKLRDSAEKRYILLKTICQGKYISHHHLRMEQYLFEELLVQLLTAGLIYKNCSKNTYGANSYSCTEMGENLLKKKEKEAREELCVLVGSTLGAFTGALISQLEDSVA